MTRLLSFCLILIAAASHAEQPADQAAQLLKAAAQLLGVGGDARSPAAAGPWEAVHAVEGDGLMLRGVAPEVCSAAEIQAARTEVRLQASCHRDGAASTLIVFVAQ
jgi:hypothetical protein